MLSISCYRNKDVGILGAGLSGLAAAKLLLSLKAEIYIFDDKKISQKLLKKIVGKITIFGLGKL